MMNNNNNHNNNNNAPPPPPPPRVDMLTWFLRLRPSTFTSSSEPIVADDWLCLVNKNLVTIGCTDAEKVRFSAHLLEGPATSWWENYRITHPIEEVNWDMFQEAFCIAHISSRVMSLKKREFRNFCQGHHTIAEYIDEFNKLARYPDDVDTDAKRRERFLDGLNDELVVQLSMVYAPNYQAQLDKATILENKQHHMKNRKRRHNHDGHGNNHHEGYVHEHHIHQNYAINNGSANGNRNGYVKGGNKSKKKETSSRWSSTTARS
jgi:hypothetical protein